MKLFSPKSFISRPITDRVKESLFDVLSNYELPQGKMVADLFCGVGSWGLEALSRGAEFVTFVENDPDIAKILNRNIEKTGFVKQSKVIKANAFKLGARVDFDKGKYELIFVDPPYAKTKDASGNSLLGNLLKMLADQLDSKGMVVVRTQNDSVLLEKYDKLSVFERRKWGDMVITFLRQE